MTIDRHILLLLPLLFLLGCCGSGNGSKAEEPAPIEIKNGDVVPVTNPNVEKFLTEVSYPDQDYSFTRVLDYYGGFDGKNFDWDKEPDSDKPMAYSIRWETDGLEKGSTIQVILEDELGWKCQKELPEGSGFWNITNLVPNDAYTYRVSSTASGKILTEGRFTTTGSLHQLFFKPGCRNCRDLGGWKTQDGKTIRYRKLYRGGRMQDETVDALGQQEILAEGIGAQLDLRNSDRILEPAVPGLAFLAPGIEQGGTEMLVKDHEKTRQCFEFVVNCLRENKPVYFHCSLGRDRTGTLDILLLGLLGVREGDIGKAYEVTYFAPVGYSVSSSERKENPTPVFRNTRKEWVYSDVVPYFWEMAGENGSFAQGVEKYLLEVAQVSQKDIDDFRNIMLQ